MARDELSLLLKTKYTAGPLATPQNHDEIHRQLAIRYNLNLHSTVCPHTH
jgi:hypothetical protein